MIRYPRRAGRFFAIPPNSDHYRVQGGLEVDDNESHVVPITIPKTGEKAYLVFGASEAPPI